MINIVDGLSKAQVKQIVKIATDKALAGREPLQGLCYNAEHKVWYITNGYVASVWYMQDDGDDTIHIISEGLPKEDSIVKYIALKAWLANAKAKDKLRWADLKDMAKPNRSVDILAVMRDEGTADNAYVNPKQLALLLPLFEYATTFTNVKRSDKIQMMKLELVNDRDYMSAKQVGLVMGLVR